MGPFTSSYRRERPFLIKEYMKPEKKETAAERYLRIKAELAKGETLHDVACPDCGMVWKARRLAVDFWVSSGILPTHLVKIFVDATKGVNGASGLTAENALQKLETKELIDSIEFSNKVVMRTAVDPHIVETPKEPNDISQEDVLTCCYMRLREWQLGGADKASGLENFPDGRRAAAVDRVDGAGHRAKSKQAA